MKTWLTATVLSASVLLCGGVALAYDLRGNPPIMQVVTTYGPLQIVGCTFNGIPNDAVQVSIMVRNRSAHKLVGFTARYRWYDPSDAKINDFTASYANLELDSGEKGSYLQTGGDGGSPIKRLVCSVTQATFGDGTTWVAGGKYHGKLLPFAAAAALRRDSLVSSMSMPMTSQQHDVDVKALLRLAVLYNVPTACNRSSADFLISSPLFFDRQHRLRRRADEPGLKAV